VAKTRILLHAFGQLDGDLVKRVVAAEADMEVIADIGEREDLVAAVQRTRADVVLASMTAAEPTAEWRRLLADATRLRLFAFAPPAATSVIAFVPHETELAEEMGVQTLVETIRNLTAAA
jgi:hypothetical protein